MRRLACAVILLALAGCTELPWRGVHAEHDPRLDLALAGPQRFALVLSSGGRRAFAHIGVLAGLEDAGIRPDLVVGTSAGALVGLLYASGLGVGDIARVGTEELVEHLADRLLPDTARGDRLEAFVVRHVGAGLIERLPVRFAAVAVDVHDGCLSVFNAGDAARAVRASASVPVFFQPARIGLRQFVDGSLACPLPAGVARALGAERVVAVDVTHNTDWLPPQGLVDRVFYGAQLMVRNLARIDRAEADLVIHPLLPPWERIEAGDQQAVIAAGYRAGLEALPAIRALLARADRAAAPSGRAPQDRRWCGAWSAGE